MADSLNFIPIPYATSFIIGNKYVNEMYEIYAARNRVSDDLSYGDNRDFRYKARKQM